MEIISAYIQYLDEELKGLNFPATPSNLYDPIRYFLDLDAKRIRPVLTLLSAELFGIKKENVLHAAIAVELFHNFTLLHDDIMDSSLLRRGKKTVHNQWDTNIAILSGDVLFVHAYTHLSKQSDIHLPYLIKLFNDTAVKLCEGQQLDMDFENKQIIDLDDYLDMIRMKTSVLLGCALQFGSIIANASLEKQKCIYDFGVNMGMAFQIQDDILDLYGDSEVLGKKIGGDVLNDKKTILNVVAYKLADKKQKKELLSISNIIDEKSKIERTRNLYNQLSVLDNCKKIAKKYSDKAICDLRNSVDIEFKNNTLYLLANQLLLRKN